VGRKGEIQQDQLISGGGCMHTTGEGRRVSLMKTKKGIYNMNNMSEYMSVGERSQRETERKSE